MVEIARALSMQSRLIVMDEPTSALSAGRGRKALPHHPRSQGAGPQHHLRHPPARGGDARSATATRCCATAAWSAAARSPRPTIDGIIRLMVGREVNALFAHRETRDAGEVALEVEGLTRRGNAQDPQRHRARRRLAVGAPRRDPRHRRAGRRRPHRDGARHLRRRSVRFRPRHRRRRAGRTSARRATRSATASAWCRRIASSRRCSSRSPIRMNLSHGRARAHLRSWRIFIDEQAETRAGRGVPQGAQHPHGEPGAARRQSVRRQPAEGGAGALAGASAEGADRRRADARHRRRRQGRGAQSALRDGAHPASPSSRSRRNCRRSWRSATASSPCARGA